MKVKIFNEEYVLMFNGDAKDFYYLEDCNKELQEVLDLFENSKNKSVTYINDLGKKLIIQKI